MLYCNNILLNYAIIIYDKTKSKMKIVQEIAEELPVTPVISYILCDSWYTCSSIMDAFIKKDLLTGKVPEYCGISALFNRIWCLVCV